MTIELTFWTQNIPSSKYFWTPMNYRKYPSSLSPSRLSPDVHCPAITENGLCNSSETQGGAFPLTGLVQCNKHNMAVIWFYTFDILVDRKFFISRFNRKCQYFHGLGGAQHMVCY